MSSLALHVSRSLRLLRSNDRSSTCSRSVGQCLWLFFSIAVLFTYRNVSNSPAAPTIVKPQEKTLHYEIGDNLTVSCEASGNPKPSVKWLKESKELRSPVEHPGGDLGILKIDEIREEHFGEYFCVAENKLGNDSVKLIGKSLFSDVTHRYKTPPRPSPSSSS